MTLSEFYSIWNTPQRGFGFPVLPLVCTRRVGEGVFHME